MLVSELIKYLKRLPEDMKVLAEVENEAFLISPPKIDLINQEFKVIPDSVNDSDGYEDVVLISLARRIR